MNDVRDGLPEEGKYVLAHVVRDNCIDSGDPVGVYWVVMKRVCGISMAKREKMRCGELPDPMVKSFGYKPNGSGERVTLSDPRSKCHQGGDEGGNNKRAYRWESFGPGGENGQDVDYWCEIPLIEESK